MTEIRKEEITVLGVAGPAGEAITTGMVITEKEDTEAAVETTKIKTVTRTVIKAGVRGEAGVGEAANPTIGKEEAEVGEEAVADPVAAIVEAAGVVTGNSSSSSSRRRPTSQATKEDEFIIYLSRKEIVLQNRLKLKDEGRLFSQG